MPNKDCPIQARCLVTFILLAPVSNLDKMDGNGEQSGKNTKGAHNAPLH